MAIKDWPEGEGPRDKLLHHGAGHLSDAELLAVLLRNGLAGHNAVDLAREMITEFGGLRALFSASQSQVCQLAGVGPVKFAQMQAASEISKRIFQENMHRGQILINPDLTRGLFNETISRPIL